MERGSFREWKSHLKNLPLYCIQFSRYKVNYLFTGLGFVLRYVAWLEMLRFIFRRMCLTVLGVFSARSEILSATCNNQKAQIKFNFLSWPRHTNPLARKMVLLLTACVLMVTVYWKVPSSSPTMQVTRFSMKQIKMWVKSTLSAALSTACLDELMVKFCLSLILLIWSFKSKKL